jgi:hypothetical protein
MAADLDTCQFEKGATATSYEPYVGGIPSPNPDYPQPVQTVTGTQTVEIFGKNLAHFIPKESKGYTPRYDADTGTIYVSGTNTDSWSNIGETVAADIPAGTYTISVDNPSSSFRYNIRLAYADNTYVNARLSKGSTSAQVTVAKNVVSMYVFFDSIDPSTTLNNWAFKLQLEAGSTATMFTPYSKQALSLDLGSIELNDLGNGYQDEIAFDGAEWKLRKKTASYTFDGSADENWIRQAPSPNNQGTGFYIRVADAVPLTPALCNEFINNNTAQSNWGIGINEFRVTNSRNAIFKTQEQGIDPGTVQDWRDKLANSNMTIVYNAYTPTETTITDQALIAQLEAIRTALLENGANTITNTAAGSNLAGDMEIGYYGYTPSSQYDKWLWLDVGAAGAHYEQI